MQGRLAQLFGAHRWRILATYALTFLENGLELAEPFLLGRAVDGLLRREPGWLAALVGVYVARTLVGTARRLYDTRVFTAIYAATATDLVARQKDAGVEVSRIVARSALSREFVEFFEHALPGLIRGVSGAVGALAMLGYYDPWIVPCCLGLFVPAGWLSRRYAGRTYRLSRRLHDQMEREVERIGTGGPGEVAAHYRRVAWWRVRLSDAEAWNFTLMESFVLALFVLVIVRACVVSSDVGDVVAMMQYLWMFIQGIDLVPEMVGRVSRLRDIGRRMGEEEGSVGAPCAPLSGV